MSDELYNILAHPEKYGMNIGYTCDSCLAGNKHVEQVVKAYTDKMKVMEDRMGATENSVKNLDSKVTKIDEKVENLVKKGEYNVMEELREREVRRRNVVLYRIPEHENEGAKGVERIEWDRRSFLNVCTALKVAIQDDDVRFCRRVGEKGTARPMIVGLYSEESKFQLLKMAKNLDKTAFKDITISNDLTKKQREEEVGMQQEATRLNGELTDEERAKNLQWAVVGAKGEKRLIRTTARDGSGRGRGARTAQRGSTLPARGRGRPPLLRTAAAAEVTEGAAAAAAETTEGSAEERRTCSRSPRREDVQ